MMMVGAPLCGCIDQGPRLPTPKFRRYLIFNLIDFKVHNLIDCLIFLDLPTKTKVNLSATMHYC